MSFLSSLNGEASSQRIGKPFHVEENMKIKKVVHIKDIGKLPGKKKIRWFVFSLHSQQYGFGAYTK